MTRIVTQHTFASVYLCIYLRSIYGLTHIEYRTLLFANRSRDFYVIIKYRNSIRILALIRYI